MKHQSLILAALVLSIIAKDGLTSGQSLCSADENIVFSCTTGKKLVSLCATQDMTADTGQLTYRFGLYGKEPELVYPSSFQKPREAFGVYFYSWPKGSSRETSFRIGDYTYTIYGQNAVYEINDRSNGSGVRVERSGKLASDLWCSDASTTDNMWDSLHDIGLPDSTEWSHFRN